MVNRSPLVFVDYVVFFFRWLTGALYLSLAILLALAIFEEPEVNQKISNIS